LLVKKYFFVNLALFGNFLTVTLDVDQVWTALKNKVFEKHEIWTILMDKVKWSLETAKTGSHGLPLLIAELTLLLQRLRLLIFECSEDAKEDQGGSIQDLFGLSEALGSAVQLPNLPNMCIKQTEKVPPEWRFLFTNDHVEYLPQTEEPADPTVFGNLAEHSRKTYSIGTKVRISVPVPSGIPPAAPMDIDYRGKL
jgi:hypothetical protein